MPWRVSIRTCKYLLLTRLCQLTSCPVVSCFTNHGNALLHDDKLQYSDPDQCPFKPSLLSHHFLLDANVYS